jgi:hypothetical protein
MCENGTSLDDASVIDGSLLNQDTLLPVPPLTMVCFP